MDNNQGERGLVADEMFPEGVGSYMDFDETTGLMDLAANEKTIHTDFMNNFPELFDDDDLS